MAPSSKQNDTAQKQQVSIHIPPGRATALGNAVDRIAVHYGALLQQWPSLTPQQREQVLAHSPLLARLRDLLRPLFEGGA